MTGQTQTDKRFVRLARGAALVTFLMIVIGAITRVTESGMGCGTYWPSCNGRLIPEFENAAVVIEFGHRLFALLVGAFALLIGLRAWRSYRQRPALFYPALLGLLLYFVQSGLGALTVALSNQWVSVLLHLGNSMFLLACYLVTWVNARAESTAPEHATLVLPRVELVLATLLSFMVALLGAAVAGTGATKACVGWPLCSGEIWPGSQGPLQILNMTHRLVAGSLGLLLILMLIQARSGIARAMRNALWVALVAYLAQAGLGALVVLVGNRDWLTVARSLHVTFAAATWAAMIIASTIAWLQHLSSSAPNNPNQQVTAPSATTSS
jgi:heme A synthase